MEIAAEGTAERVNRTDHAAFLGMLEEMRAASRGEPENFGLLLVHLRQFSRLNSSLGYDAGDSVLSDVAGRLVSGFSQRAQVVRIGACTFAILLNGVKNGEHALLAAKKVERLVQEPSIVAGQKVLIDVAQGLAVYPEHANTADELFQRAEIALNTAKNTHPSISLYSTIGIDELQNSMRVESALRNAISENALELYVQPQVDVVTAAPVGAEALLRCRDEDGVIVSTEAVIQVAERLQLLSGISHSMLNAALRNVSEWAAVHPQFRVSVNVSPSMLGDPDLVDSVASALNVWGVSPEALVIEITESAFMFNPEKSFMVLRRLRDLGVRISIDDFGTGYSSLSYFKNIPANELKVDQSFVTNMLNDASDRKIVRTVINLAHEFDLDVVAEGVEDCPTLTLLQEMGCNTAQGYWFSRPMPSAEFQAWLADYSDTLVASSGSPSL